MNKLLKRILASTVLTAALLVPVAVPAMVSAVSHSGVSISDNLCAGASLDVSGKCSDPDQESSKEKINGIIKLVINIFSVLVGFVSVVMIIIAGLKYVTSGGASDKVTSAKDTILYAVVGLIVVALSQTIVFFVLGQTTKSI